MNIYGRGEKARGVCVRVFEWMWPGRRRTQADLWPHLERKGRNGHKNKQRGAFAADICLVRLCVFVGIIKRCGRLRPRPVRAGISAMTTRSGVPKRTACSFSNKLPGKKQLRPENVKKKKRTDSAANTKHGLWAEWHKVALMLHWTRFTRSWLLLPAREHRGGACLPEKHVCALWRESNYGGA